MQLTYIFIAVLLFVWFLSMMLQKNWCTCYELNLQVEVTWLFFHWKSNTFWKFRSVFKNMSIRRQRQWQNKWQNRRHPNVLTVWALVQSDDDLLCCSLLYAHAWSMIHPNKTLFIVCIYFVPFCRVEVFSSKKFFFLGYCTSPLHLFSSNPKKGNTPINASCCSTTTFCVHNNMISLLLSACRSFLLIWPWTRSRSFSYENIPLWIKDRFVLSLTHNY